MRAKKVQRSGKKNNKKGVGKKEMGGNKVLRKKGNC